MSDSYDQQTNQSTTNKSTTLSLQRFFCRQVIRLCSSTLRLTLLLSGRKKLNCKRSYCGQNIHKRTFEDKIYLDLHSHVKTANIWMYLLCVCGFFGVTTLVFLQYRSFWTHTQNRDNEWSSPELVHCSQREGHFTSIIGETPILPNLFYCVCFRETSEVVKGWEFTINNNRQPICLPP